MGRPRREDLSPEKRAFYDRRAELYSRRRQKHKEAASYQYAVEIATILDVAPTTEQTEKLRNYIKRTFKFKLN